MSTSSLERLVVEIAERQRSSFYGKYRGVVTNVEDPDNMGRIKTNIPEVLADVESPWALPCAAYAGDGVGSYTVPPVGAGVWIEFEAGDPARPIWAGCWWGTGQLPTNESGAEANPSIKIIRTETGMMVSMNDDTQELSISDQNGDNILKIEVNSGTITLKGAIKAIVEAPAIELVENASHPVVFGDELITYLSQLVNMYQTHTHPGQTAIIPVTPAPPVPPFPPPTPSLISMKVKAG